MRRYTTFPSQAFPILSYLSKDGQMMAGSMPVRSWRQACDLFQTFEAPQAGGLVHLTLSMPVGWTLADDVWLAVARRVLTASGLPSEMVPWVMWGREATRCDHIHLVAARQTYTGRHLEIATSVRETDRIERDVCQFLGLPEPVWRPDPEMVLAPPITVRGAAEIRTGGMVRGRPERGHVQGPTCQPFCAQRRPSGTRLPLVADLVRRLSGSVDPAQRPDGQDHQPEARGQRILVGADFESSCTGRAHSSGGADGIPAPCRRGDPQPPWTDAHLERTLA
ncbi:hypothetical protein AN189_12555 [Loktanella sp. 3ANDIMAR09]|nr:hypothetical protein AN189_12555 [Loktanella sp. 3ANDIMAR09]